MVEILIKQNKKIEIRRFAQGAPLSVPSTWTGPRRTSADRQYGWLVKTEKRDEVAVDAKERKYRKAKPREPENEKWRVWLSITSGHSTHNVHVHANKLRACVLGMHTPLLRVSAAAKQKDRGRLDLAMVRKERRDWTA